MVFKTPRNPPHELLMLQHLHSRMMLPANFIKIMRNHKKGLEGELHFDSYLKGISVDSIILRSLLFELNNEYFQIDTLLISPSTLYLFEVKNYSGEYQIRHGKWYNSIDSLTKDPTLQLYRCETLFRQLLSKLNQTQFEIKPLVVFPNLEFTLFHASKDLPVILPTQISKFVHQLNSTSPNFKLPQQCYDLSDMLISYALAKYPFPNLPEYNFNQLIKEEFRKKLSM
ncbi:nuclease-related domain-containing protein [Salipaludibacillus sp. CF4.18]|uniref:nuclease-related domain-containing protein n=1 Tax=Salipaludibacillus sp. CF4.18 TaxID=3373081 RepID=UPI003EE6D7A3